ncbi:MAG: preprotein translocase subunit SecG [Burkholderiaceae bacterium]|nr:MAG: preprotein translocase subunit SecG [Burkholderiaceae bacterium]
MQIFYTLIAVVQVISALAVIGLVLIQHGKGADMGAAFGSGASGSLFGATGSANFLSRTTAVLAGVFLVSTLALAYIATSKPKGATGGVMDSLIKTAPAQDVPAAPAAPSTVPAAPAAPQGGQIPK